MNRQTNISKSELDVIQVVWQLNNATVREVFEKVAQEKDVAFKTVQTYLRRLEAKGYLRSRVVKGSRVYRPRVGSNRVVRETVQDLLRSLFSGQAFPLMQHLIQEHGIEGHDVEKLRKMLDDLEGGGNESSRK